MNKKKLVSLLVLFFFILSIFPAFQLPNVDATETLYSVTNEADNGQLNQKWIVTKVITENAIDYFSIVNNNTSKALSLSNETVVQEDYVAGNSTQLWEIKIFDANNYYYSVRNKSNNKFLSLKNGVNTIAGQELAFADTAGPGHTLFQFSWTTVVSGGIYTILSVWPIFRLQGNGDTVTNDFPVLARSESGQSNQKWKIDRISTVNNIDYYTITNARTGKVLSYNVTYFTQENYVPSNDAQLWTFQTVGNFGCVIVNKKINGNIILSNTTNNAPGALTLSTWDSTWGYNSNGYGLWLFDGGLTFTNGSTYTLKTYAPTYYMQGNGDSVQSDFPVTTVASNSQNNQKWTVKKISTENLVDYYSIINENTKKALTLSDDTVIQEGYLSGNSAQLWEIKIFDVNNYYYTVKNKANSKYLSLESGVTQTAGKGLAFENTAGPGHTLFQFSNTAVVSNVKYTIASVWPALFLQGNGTASADDFLVSAQNVSNHTNQKWKIDKIITVNSIDYYTLTSVKTGKVLYYDGLNFSQEDYTAGDDEQLWAFKREKDYGSVIINKKVNGNITLSNTTNDAPGELSLSPWDSTWGYNGNGYGLWLFDGGLSFTNGSTYTLNTYSPTYYLQSGSNLNIPPDPESTLKLDLKNNKNSQKWIFNSVKISGITYYKITNYYSNKLLTATELNNVLEMDSKAVNGVDSDSQLWQLDVTTSGQYDGYAIISKLTGYCISAKLGDASVALDKVVLKPIESRYIGSSMWVLNGMLNIRDGAPHKMSLIWPGTLYLTSFGQEFVRPQVPVGNETYYVSSSTGSDSNNGLSVQKPFKTITKLNSITLKAGNKVFLKKGDVFTNGLRVNGKGTESNWIKISSYGSSNKNPTIKVPKDTKAMFIYDTSNIEVLGIDIQAALEVVSGTVNNQQAMTEASEGAGILVSFSSSIRISNCNVMASRNTSAGISFTDCADPENADKTNIVINNCTVDGAVMGIGITQSNQFTVINSKAVNCFAWGMASVISDDGLFYNCLTDNVGFGQNKYGNCAMMAAWSHRIDFDHCYMYNTQRGPQPYDGCGFDFEGGGNNQSDIRLMNSIIDGTDGCGVFVFNNLGSGGTKNFLISNVVIKNYGRNYGNTKEGIHFVVGAKQEHSSGAVIDTVFINEGKYDFYNEYPKDINNVSFVSDDLMFMAVKEDLKRYTEIASGKIRSNESDTVWREIQNAINNAKNVYNNPASTDREVNEAILLLLIERIDSGTYKFVDDYVLNDISLKDYSVKETNPVNPQTPTITTPITPKSIYDNITKEILDKLIASTTGTMVTVNTRQADVLTADMLKALKDAQKTLKINIVSQDGMIQFVWIFDTIMDVSKDVNLSLNNIIAYKDKIMKIVGSKATQIISFKNLVSLPGKTRIIILNSAGFKANDLMNLYIYNSSSNKLEALSDHVSISKDGKYLAFEIKQGADYVVSSYAKLVETKPVNAPNSLSLGLIILLIVLVIILIGGSVLVFIFFKRKKEAQRN